MTNLTKLAKLTKFCQRIPGQDILLPVGQVCQLCHAIFLHGDIGESGDIANIAILASAFFESL